MPRFNAIVSPTFQPAMRLITGITNASSATITTSFDHDFLIGLIVRFIVPSEYGMIQLHHKTGRIVTVPSTTTFTVEIDTTNYDTYIAVASPEPWYVSETSQVIPVAEVNSSLAQATRNVLT